MTTSVWPPLAGLGDAAPRVSRALAAEPVASVEASIQALQPGSSPVREAALDAARFALALRSGSVRAGADGVALRHALLAVNDLLGADFVLVEEAALSSPRVGLALLRQLSDDLVARSPALAAAALRVEGSFARATGDLRASLALLGRSVAFARASGSPRELVRSQNTLGTSYVSLALAAPARAVLLPALELASAVGERQSIAIAEGQLAVLALDEGDTIRAIRGLERQATICRELADDHGLARACSLLVEAYGRRSRLEDAHRAADEARAIHRRAGQPWTARQALFATVYEAETAYAHGRLDEGDALLRDVSEGDEALAGPLRSRRALAALVRAETLATPLVLPDLARLFDDLRASPRPAWVERGLALAAPLLAHPAHRRALAVRATLLAEARAACAAPLARLATLDETSALDRAMARARDLVGAARLALAPVEPWEARVTFLEAPSARELDRLVGLVLERAAASLSGDDLLVSSQGPLRVLFARVSGGGLDEWLADLGREREAMLFSTTARVAMTDDPTASLALVPAPWHVPPHVDDPRAPLPPSP